MTDAASVFGFLGSVTAALLFFPQVVKSYRTGRTKDVAWSSIMLGMIDGLVWIVYGFLRADPFIYVTNIVLFAGASLLALLKRMHG